MNNNKNALFKIRKSMRIAADKAGLMFGSAEILAQTLIEAEGLQYNPNTNELSKDGKIVGHYGGIAQDEFGYFVQIHLTEPVSSGDPFNTEKPKNRMTPVSIDQTNVAFLYEIPAPHPVKPPKPQPESPKVPDFFATDGITVNLNTGEIDLKNGNVSEHAKAFWNELKQLAQKEKKDEEDKKTST